LHPFSSIRNEIGNAALPLAPPYRDLAVGKLWIDSGNHDLYQFVSRWSGNTVKAVFRR
jgi:hypothetical protein